jgi:hypothetical protein
MLLQNPMMLLSWLSMSVCVTHGPKPVPELELLVELVELVELVLDVELVLLVELVLDTLPPKPDVVVDVELVLDVDDEVELEVPVPPPVPLGEVVVGPPPATTPAPLPPLPSRVDPCAQLNATIRLATHTAPSHRFTEISC